MFKKFIFFGVILFSSISFANEIRVQDYLGQFNGSYRNFFSTVDFSIVLEEYGQMTLIHPELGVCGTNGRESYEYKLYVDDEPLVMKGHDRVISLSGTVFCPNAWYYLIIEMEIKPPQSGAFINAALLLQDNRLSDVVKKKTTLIKAR